MVGQQFTPQERAFLVRVYIETGSRQETIRQFQHEYPDRQAPSPSTVWRNYQKYVTHGTSTNRNMGNSGRPRTVRSPANVEAVRQTLNLNPHSSARRNDLPQISRSSFNRITHRDLKWHAYHIQKRHALQQGDHQRRINFCQWLVNRPDRFLSDVIIGDEAAFHMNGEVNSWNVRCYAENRNGARNFTYDIPNDQRKLVVWVGLVGDNTIISPFFFHGNVNEDSYLQMINNQVVPELQRYGRGRNGAVLRKWWFQDGAPAHRRRDVRDRLQELFPNRVVALGHQPEWPARSPDLTPLDFFLWGYLKEKVYHTVPANLDDLRNRINREVQALRRTRMVRRAVQDMARRAQRCIQLQGAQVEGQAGLPDQH